MTTEETNDGEQTFTNEQRFHIWFGKPEKFGAVSDGAEAESTDSLWEYYGWTTGSLIDASNVAEQYADGRVVKINDSLDTSKALAMFNVPNGDNGQPRAYFKRTSESDNGHE